MFEKLVVKFFSWYIKRSIDQGFSSFTYDTISADPTKAILMLANHFSWWDGFLLFQINRKILKKRFHVMVTEENYKKVFFLKYLGAFPVKKNSKSALESLKHAGHLLDDPLNLILIFPQGKLYSNQVDEVVFQRGLTTIVNSSKKNFQYLFAASFVDYFEKRKPSVRCYLQIWEDAGDISLELIKIAYNNHYNYSRQQQCRITV